MTTVQQAYEQLRQQLQTLYDQREAAAIAAAVITHITGLDNTGRLINKHQQLTQEQEEYYHAITKELFQQKPLQYILHEAPFYSMHLYVDENVLIPRPETEELVQWIIDEVNAQSPLFNFPYSILDIGTGSGCIPIALRKHLPATAVHAIDISEKALAVAQKNAAVQGVPVQFHILDILNKSDWEQLPRFDIIVSNPPYITEKEAMDMHNNVLLHEPHTALFVPDEQPLLFYEAIASFGLRHLNNNSLLFFEINEAYGKEVVNMLAARGYQNVELKKDMQGNDRMVKAVLFG